MADNKPQAKILIALTCQRLVFAPTVFSLMGVMTGKKGYQASYYQQQGCDIVSQRNRCVLTAKELNATHILFVDYDMVFPSDAVQKLLDQDKDIIGAAYNFRREESIKSTAVPLDKDEQVPPEELPTETFKSKALGTGFLLIKMEVFEKVAKPWFMFAYNQDGVMMQGEDTFFCQNAIAAGYDVWADPNLGVKHLGEKLY